MKYRLKTIIAALLGLSSSIYATRLNEKTVLAYRSEAAHLGMIWAGQKPSSDHLPYQPSQQSVEITPFYTASTNHDDIAELLEQEQHSR